MIYMFSMFAIIFARRRNYEKNAQDINCDEKYKKKKSDLSK